MEVQMFLLGGYRIQTINVTKYRQENENFHYQAGKL